MAELRDVYYLASGRPQAIVFPVFANYVAAVRNVAAWVFPFISTDTEMDINYAFF